LHNYAAGIRKTYQQSIYTVMKKVILFGWAVLCMLLVVSACKKKKDGERCGEAEIKVTTTPAAGTVDPPALGTSSSLIVNINEGMPPSGVTIEVKARPETSGGTVYFSETRPNVVSGSNNFLINNTPTGVTCIVEIKVTSSTCNVNSWTGSYRYSVK
jgi:hypothetical protein